MATGFAASFPEGFTSGRLGERSKAMSADEPMDRGDARTLLDLLPPRQREIMRLRVVVGLSAQETAERLGMAPSAVRLAQHTALDRLRAALGER